MWATTTRRQHSRAGLRYVTDLTDDEWAVIAPRTRPVKAAVDGIAHSAEA